jgi:hypothetical protein
VEMAEGRRPPGRPRRRRADNIKHGPYTCAVVRTDLAQDRDQWWALVGDRRASLLGSPEDGHRIQYPKRRVLKYNTYDRCLEL